jgi:hypothetical protein
LRDSTFIALSDRVTDDTHRWLAGQNFLTYQYASGTVPAPSWDASPTTALAPMETSSPTAAAATGQPAPLLPEENL